MILQTLFITQTWWTFSRRRGHELIQKYNVQMRCLQNHAAHLHQLSEAAARVDNKTENLDVCDGNVDDTNVKYT